MDDINKGEDELITSKIVLEEIKQNPHDETRENQLNLIEILVDEIVPVQEDIVRNVKKLEKAGIEIIDAQLLATSIKREAKFWTGDHDIITEENKEDIDKIINNSEIKGKLRYMIE